MRLKLLTLLTALFTFTNLTAQRQEISPFQQRLSWIEIQKKAKAEHKHIFVDCYATWCQPCKEMDQNVFAAEIVKRYLDTFFISVKVQADTTDHDGPDVRDSYGDASRLLRTYKISSFPTYLFLDSNGEIVHKGIGYKPIEAFLALANQSRDTAEQLYTLLNKYRMGTLSPARMKYLSQGLRKISEGAWSREIANVYIDNYLLKIDSVALFTKSNIQFIKGNIEDSKSIAFNWLYHHSGKIDDLMGYMYSESLIDQIITREEIDSTLINWNSQGKTYIKGRDWLNLKNRISARFDLSHANRAVLNAQIRWYTYKKLWNRSVSLNIRKVEKYRLDTVPQEYGKINDIAYLLILEHSRDKGAIRLAIKWMKAISDRYPENPQYLDTYANLLYKEGKSTAFAVSLEEKAFALNTKDSDIENNLIKMKEGQPTWQVN